MKDQGVNINVTMWHKQCQSSKIHPTSSDNLATLQYCEFFIFNKLGNIKESNKRSSINLDCD